MDVGDEPLALAAGPVDVGVHAPRERISAGDITRGNGDLGEVLGVLHGWLPLSENMGADTFIIPRISENLLTKWKVFLVQIR